MLQVGHRRPRWRKRRNTTACERRPAPIALFDALSLSLSLSLSLTHTLSLSLTHTRIGLLDSGCWLVSLSLSHCRGLLGSGCWVVAAGAEACTYCAKWERAGALYCVLACCGRLCMLLGVVCGAERSTSERGEQSAHTAPRAPWQQRRDELHGRQILADFGRLCMRMRAAHLWSRTDVIEGGPARAAAGDHARARVSESQSFTSAQRALTHHTSDHISNTPTQDTQRKRNSETPHTPPTRDTRARPRAHGGDIDVGARGPGVTRESVARKLRD